MPAIEAALHLPRTCSVRLPNLLPKTAVACKPPPRHKCSAWSAAGALSILDLPRQIVALQAVREELETALGGDENWRALQRTGASSGEADPDRRDRDARLVKALEANPLYLAWSNVGEAIDALRDADAGFDAEDETDAIELPEDIRSRIRVDAAGQGVYTALHRDSIDDVLRDLKEHHAAAVLVSVNCCTPRDATRVAMLVREFPRVPTVALLSDLAANAPGAVLTLGRSGIQTLVDVRQPAGWRRLRDVLLADQSRDINRLALAQLSVDLAGAHPDCWRFFEVLFTRPSGIGTIRLLSRHLGVIPSTLMSRFFRARLPAPKRYLAMARLVQAAQLFENPGLSISNVANRLDYSSPQSFGRHIRGLIHLTAVEFRQRYDGEGMLQRFRSDLVIPFLSCLRTFTPLSVAIVRGQDRF